MQPHFGAVQDKVAVIFFIFLSRCMAAVSQSGNKRISAFFGFFAGFQNPEPHSRSRPALVPESEINKAHNQHLIN